MTLRVIYAVLVALALVFSSVVAAARPDTPQVHRVFKGQHLGMIAKRYNVSVEAICQANDLSPKGSIRPGQTLYIPPKDDPDGSRTRAYAEKQKREEQRKPAAKTQQKPPPKAARKAPTGKLHPPRVHRVAPRQHLGMIAKRYNVSVEALRSANEIGRKSPIRPGQRLYIPWPSDEDGSAAREYARKHPAPADESGRGKDRSRKGRDEKKNKNTKRRKLTWQDYRRPPWRRGFVELQGLNGTWRGYVVGKGGKVLGGARKAFARILATSDGRKIKIHPRLIRLIAKVSDTFGGRPIRVVSGFRLESTARRSRHKVGSALDFSIPGVPNKALRDYAMTFAKVGVGYYPNSHFIHFDVRERWTYWIDYSGPGQAPRYAGVSTKKPK